MSAPCAQLFSASVDLDGLGCYAAIHGLEPKALDERALRAVPEVALLRFCEAFEKRGIRATFFAIGQELALPEAAATHKRAAQAGHEIASHSFAHDYALSRRTQPEIEADLAKAELSISNAVDITPRGFRAPGYTLSPALLAALRARGYAYDSSLLPSPIYYSAKAAAIALHKLRGRQSHSILGNVGQLFGPRGAHLRGGVHELPVSTLPLVRAPVIGTVVMAVSESIAARLAHAAFARPSRPSSADRAVNPSAPSARRAHFNLELHGIDLLDQTDHVPAELARLQPGLRLPSSIKMKRLDALLRSLQERAESCTLEEASRHLFS